VCRLSKYRSRNTVQRYGPGALLRRMRKTIRRGACQVLRSSQVAARSPANAQMGHAPTTRSSFPFAWEARKWVLGQDWPKRPSKSPENVLMDCCGIRLGNIFGARSGSIFAGFLNMQASQGLSSFASRIALYVPIKSGLRHPSHHPVKINPQG
jgi:hypothetical protein